MILEEQDVAPLLLAMVNSMPAATLVYAKDYGDVPELVFKSGPVVTRSRLNWISHEVPWAEVLSSFVLRTAQVHFFSVAHERGGYS